MIHIKRATIIQINIFRCEDIIFSHERISYRFYQFVNTQYTSNFCIVKVYTSCCKEVTVSLIGHFRLLLGVEDTVDVGQKNKRTNKTIKTKGLGDSVLLRRVLCLLHQEGAACLKEYTSDSYVHGSISMRLSKLFLRLAEHTNSSRKRRFFRTPALPLRRFSV